MLDVASQRHLRICCDQINAFGHSPVRRRSRSYDTRLGRRRDRRPQVVQSCVVSNRHVLVNQRVSHSDQPCFNLTTSVVFNFFRQRMSLPLATSASLSMLSSDSTAFSLSMKCSFKLSLLPDSVRIASFVLTIFETYATAWCPINHLCDPNWDQPQHHTLRAFLLRWCADGLCSITGKPHIVCTVLATP